MSKNTSNKKELSPKQREELLKALKARFEKNLGRHKGLVWAKVQARLEARPEKLWSLEEMERTGGEPDVVGHDKSRANSSSWIVPRKVPRAASVFATTARRWIRERNINPKTASWIGRGHGHRAFDGGGIFRAAKAGRVRHEVVELVETPADIRKLGGALYCDRRYGRVFVGHNGAQSYYGGRGFRGSLRV